MKTLRKILCILLTVLLLTACNSNNQVDNKKTNETAKKYLTILDDYVSHDKSFDNLVDDQEFADFLNQAFVDYCSSDYIEMRAFVSDYKSFGVTKPEVSWGQLIYQDYSSADFFIDKYEQLQTFDYDKLSYTQQYEYEKYEYYLLEKICAVYFKEYESLFSYTYDLLNYVFFNIDEFIIENKEFCDDFVTLFADVDRYLEEGIIYSQKQANNGVYPNAISLSYSYDYALQLIGEGEDSAFLKTFNKHIDEASYLSDDEKASYKQQGAKIVEEEINPTLKKVSEELQKYTDKISDIDSLYCNINQDYARYKLILNSSTNIDTEELEAMLVDVLLDVSEKYKAARNDEVVWAEYEKVQSDDCYEEFLYDDIETMQFLEDHYAELFPQLESVNYIISRLDGISDGSSVVAYQVQPTVDNTIGTVIRTNPNIFGNNHIDDFAVLAHEGIPGHMYQNLYYCQQDLPALGQTFMYIGYRESWSTYTMFKALEFTQIENEGVIDIARFTWLSGYLLTALADIHYQVYGESVEQFAQYLDSLGFKKELAESLLINTVRAPFINTQYGAGYTQLVKLIEEAQSHLRSIFNLKAFHKEYIIHGHMSFVTAKKAIEDYIQLSKVITSQANY